jgi:hypothetical protein
MDFSFPRKMGGFLLKMFLPFANDFYICAKIEKCIFVSTLAPQHFKKENSFVSKFRSFVHVILSKSCLNFAKLRNFLQTFWRNFVFIIQPDLFGYEILGGKGHGGGGGVYG